MHSTEAEGFLVIQGVLTQVKICQNKFDIFADGTPSGGRENEMNKKLILRILLIVAISLIIGFGMYATVAKYIARNPFPMPFGVGISVVQSGSMEPTLSVGDLIFVGESESYTVGDIVVFDDGKSLVVHKIISIDGDTVITQGDANNIADSPIQMKEIYGKVKFSVVGVGYVVNVLKSTPVTVAILALAVWLYILTLKWERKDEDEKKARLKAQLQKEIDEYKSMLNK